MSVGLTSIGLALAGLLALAGCYRPSNDLASCALRCVAGQSDCPEDLVCNAEGRCSAAGAACEPDAGLADAPPDGDPPGMFCIGTAPIRPCFDSEPSGIRTLSASFDTSTGPCDLVTTLAGREVCVLAANQLAITGKPHFSGARPLVLVGVFSISIAQGATLDLSSSELADPRRGAGSDPADCDPPDAATTADQGGAGGTFAGQGGDGGLGTGGGARIRATAVVSPIAFRGGCSGSGGTGSTPGPGGGAVYLISNAIRFDGDVRATGGGGGAGGASSAGAGGGTGGYIGVDATTVTFGTQGRLVATGGGGGGGSCDTFGSPGLDADTGTNIIAGGGPGALGMGDGGTGGNLVATTANAGGDTSTLGCGGGGGGGGVGTIQFFRGTSCGNRCFPAGVTQ